MGDRGGRLPTDAFCLLPFLRSRHPALGAAHSSAPPIPYLAPRGRGRPVAGRVRGCRESRLATDTRHPRTGQSPHVSRFTTPVPAPGAWRSAPLALLPASLLRSPSVRLQSPISSPPLPCPFSLAQPGPHFYSRHKVNVDGGARSSLSPHPGTAVIPSPNGAVLHLRNVCPKRSCWTTKESEWTDRM